MTADDVWFNGYRHLTDQLGAGEGEVLGNLLAAAPKRWNQPFAGKAVVVPDDGALPQIALAGGAVLTLLSPYRENLAALAAEWTDEMANWAEKELAQQKKVAGDKLGKREPLEELDIDLVKQLADPHKTPFSEDATKPNGSSIAFLFEHGGRRLLFGADAHPSRLLRSIERLSPNGPLALDAFKLSHHGSANNLSPALLAKIDCPRFLVSSNGDSYGHPNPETLARIVTSSPNLKSLCFNYRGDYTRVWDERSVKERFCYDVAYPSGAGDAGFVLELE